MTETLALSEVEGRNEMQKEIVQKKQHFDG
jgi:hypothetical protein